MLSFARPALALSATTCLLSIGVTAHGNHVGHQAQVPVAPDADWATRHLAEEHHINNFDPTAFFVLHDFDGAGFWSRDDVRKLYGLMDVSADSIPETKKSDVVQTVFEMFDHNHDSQISLDEFLEANQMGKTLPDFGTGPGHHGDIEYEYEIHHFEKFHSGDNVREEDLTHPEDIEHFRMHDELEAKEEAWEARERMGIVVENIPAKFLRKAR